LLAANAFVRDRPRLVRALSVSLVALELVVAVSALQRLRLYEQAFGLTELRLYATGIVVWLACVFGWLCVTTLRARKHFAVGALALGFAATAALNVVNPDALIARTNLTRPHVDVRYLGGLSDDALPTLIVRLPRLRPALRSALAARMLARTEAGDGVLSWNASRSRARSLLVKHRTVLLRFARPAR
jgi:hypothetical protein